jgi:indolepyruvate ferredoxin oxidoreductase beta subunit
MKTFNLILTGYGGQGVITMAEILAKAALLQGYDVKQAEIHGLAQRGGALECHLRFGQKVFSPLVTQADADLIISLDLLEALRATYYANSKTQILTNSKLFSPYPFEPKRIDSIKVINDIKKITQNLKLVEAEKMVQKFTKDTAMINILMLGFASAFKLVPIKKELIVKAIKERIRPIFIETNLKIFHSAFFKKN